jgi:hypothetical protein
MRKAIPRATLRRTDIKEPPFMERTGKQELTYRKADLQMKVNPCKRRDQADHCEESIKSTPAGSNPDPQPKSDKGKTNEYRERGEPMLHQKDHFQHEKCAYEDQEQQGREQTCSKREHKRNDLPP